MPMFLEPNQQFSISLDSDMEKPIESRPVFFAKSLSMRQQTQLAKELDEALEQDTSEKVFDFTCNMLAKYVIGFKNMGQFNFGDDYRDFLSHNEARELLRKVGWNQHLIPDEKKS